MYSWEHANILIYPLEFENKIPDIMMELALQGKKYLPRKKRENGKKEGT